MNSLIGVLFVCWSIGCFQNVLHAFYLIACLKVQSAQLNALVWSINVVTCVCPLLMQSLKPLGFLFICKFYQIAFYFSFIKLYICISIIVVYRCVCVCVCLKVCMYDKKLDMPWHLYYLACLCTCFFLSYCFISRVPPTSRFLLQS